MRQYSVEITNIQVEITFSIPKSLHMPKELNGLKWPDIVTLDPNREEFPRSCGQEDRAAEDGWERRGLAEWRRDLARGRDDMAFYYKAYLVLIRKFISVYN